MKDMNVDKDIAKAEGLPARVFTDPAILELELETIFKKNWLLVPESSAEDARTDARPWDERLKQRGARAPLTMLDRPLYLQRGWKDSKLRLLPNVCTHAWYPLTAGEGRSEKLICAQHGRQYDAAGKCLSQPGFPPKAGVFPRACDHLTEFETKTYGPLLFTCFGGPELPLEKITDKIDESIGALPIEKLKRRPQKSEFREVDGNWKQHAWNYMDKFHVQFLHKAPGGLADAIELASYKTELHEGCSLQWAFAKDPDSGFDPDFLPARLRAPGKTVFALWWFIYPNLTLNFYPWGLSVNSYEPIPGRPDKSLFRWYSWSWDDKKMNEREKCWLSEQVDTEDVEAMTLVRRGARSGLAPRGRFSATEETGPHWFHHAVSRALLAR